MFDNDRYITCGINEEIDVEIQIALWNFIDNLKKKDFEIDYLQVFELKSIENGDRFNQEIIHSQEVPEYKKKYLTEVGKPVNAKIFVIDDKSHSTMLLGEEY